jgi:hypothetical protein
MEDLGKKYSKKVLKLIVDKISSKFNLDIDDTREDNQLVIDKVLGYFGIKINSFEDYSFWGTLVRDNLNVDNFENLKVPKLRKHKVYITLNQTVFRNNYTVQSVYSYYDDEILVKEQLLNDEEFDWWDGDLIDTDIYDSETTDFTITKINKVQLDESKKNEKRLVENYNRNKEKIMKLQTLKVLIEQRIKSLSS